MADVAHRSQTGLNAAHPPFYVSESDPGTALGAHRVWFKPSTKVAKIRNATNTDWDDISIEGTSAGSAPSLADLSDVDVITTPPADGEALVWDDTAGEWVPGSVAAGSVDAADVAYAGGTGMSATNVETAIDELATEKANDSALTAHIDDAADAHDATAISYAGGTGMSATHVEGAIDELATEKADAARTISTTAPLTGGGDLSANRTLAVSAASESASGVIETATQGETNTGTDDARAVTPLKLKTNVDLHINDTSAAHAASAISFTPAGSVASTNVQAAIEEVASEAGGGGSASAADETTAGIAEVATTTETNTGTDDARMVTPLKLAGRTSTETRAGVIEVATQAETDTGTDDTRAVTPLKLASYSGLGGSTAAAPIPVLSVFTGNSQVNWANQPSALTEFGGTALHRVQADLTNATQARIVTQMFVVGVSGAELRVQYSTDNGSNWNYLDHSAGPAVAINSLNNQAGSWVNLNASAKADVLLRIVGINGNGVADPAFSQVQVQVK